MTDDLRSLGLLLAQAERQRDEALAEQLKLEAAWRAAAAQAEQLVLYRREYEQRWSAEFCREGKIELVRCYQGFIERLSQAVEQQERIAGHAAAQVERATAIMRGHDIRAAALKKLVERRLKEGERVAAGREQRLSDEHASRAAWVAIRRSATRAARSDARPADERRCLPPAGARRRTRAAAGADAGRPRAGRASLRRAAAPKPRRRAGRRPARPRPAAEVAPLPHRARGDGGERRVAVDPRRRAQERSRPGPRPRRVRRLRVSRHAPPARPNGPAAGPGRIAEGDSAGRRPRPGRRLDRDAFAAGRCAPIPPAPPTPGSASARPRHARPAPTSPAATPTPTPRPRTAAMRSVGRDGTARRPGGRRRRPRRSGPRRADRRRRGGVAGRVVRAAARRREGRRPRRCRRPCRAAAAVGDSRRPRPRRRPRHADTAPVPAAAERCPSRSIRPSSPPPSGSR